MALQRPTSRSRADRIARDASQASVKMRIARNNAKVVTEVVPITNNSAWSYSSTWAADICRKSDINGRSPI